MQRHPQCTGEENFNTRTYRKGLAATICRALQDSRRTRRKAIHQFISSVAFGTARSLTSQQGH